MKIGYISIFTEENIFCKKKKTPSIKLKRHLHSEQINSYFYSNSILTP